MISDNQFRAAALTLKKCSHPDAWANFMGAFEAYTYKVIGECVDAPLESVVLTQGGARHCKKLLQMLTECEPQPKKDKP